MYPVKKFQASFPMTAKSHLHLSVSVPFEEEKHPYFIHLRAFLTKVLTKELQESCQSVAMAFMHSFFSELNPRI